MLVATKTRKGPHAPVGAWGLSLYLGWFGYLIEPLRYRNPETLKALRVVSGNPKLLSKGSDLMWLEL